ncbi:NAD-dependent protein deacetylase [Balamuthia mandrillaris]
MQGFDSSSDFLVPPEYFDTEELIACGALPADGVELKARVSSSADLQRLLFKSDGATLFLEELDMEQPPGTARLCSLHDMLAEVQHKVEGSLRMMQRFEEANKLSERIQRMLTGEESFTLKIRDPLGISFIGTRSGEGKEEDGEFAQVHRFARSWEEDEELGVLPEPPDEQADTIDALVVGFTGAGISTESGIPAFRNVLPAPSSSSSSFIQTEQQKELQAEQEADKAEQEDAMTPIWSRFDPDLFQLSKLLQSEEARKAYWQLHLDLNDRVATAKPNPAHLIFARLAEQGKLRAVITQNIDGLHNPPDHPLLPSKELLFELHGNNQTAKCQTCRTVLPLKAVEDTVRAGEDAHCDACGGVILPGVVAFGAKLDDDVLQGAREAAQDADLVLVMGTGLLVAPANTIPTAAMKAGAKLAIVNVGATKLDHWAAVKVEDRCGEVMQKVIERLC